MQENTTKTIQYIIVASAIVICVLGIVNKVVYGQAQEVITTRTCDVENMTREDLQALLEFQRKKQITDKISQLQEQLNNLD